VLQIADQEGVDRFIFFGFSMGGRVGFELAVQEPSRVEGLIVGGMHGLKPSIDRRNLERRVAVLRSAKWRLVERAVGARSGDGRDNVPEALALSTEAVLDWAGSESRLPAVKALALLFCGELDSLLEYAEQTAGLIPGCSFVSLPSTTHAASFYSSEQARDEVRRFLA
jgi:pimeloyl-ACP methyl ester carboxylesterase